MVSVSPTFFRRHTVAGKIGILRQRPGVVRDRVVVFADVLMIQPAIEERGVVAWLCAENLSEIGNRTGVIFLFLGQQTVARKIRLVEIRIELNGFRIVGKCLVESLCRVVLRSLVIERCCGRL